MKPDLVTPERMLLRWGENCLYHCILAYRTAQQQHNKHTTTTENNNTADQQSMKTKQAKNAERTHGKRLRERDSVKCSEMENERETLRSLVKTEGEKERNRRQIASRRFPGLIRASQAWLFPYSFAPPMRSFSSFMSQKEARLKMKGYTQATARAHGVKRGGEDPHRKGPCCYSKHLPLCGRPSRPIVVQEISRAPFGSLWLQRHAADPLVVSGSDTWSGRCVAPATITTGCGPLPSLPQHSISPLSLTHSLLFASEEHFWPNVPIVFSLSFVLPLSLSPVVCMLIVSLEHPHYTHGCILRASLFDLGLVGSER